MVMEYSYNDVLEHVDMNNMLLAAKGWGVISGLGVDASSNMSVNVAAGSCLINSSKYTEGSTVNVAITAADATHARKDLIIYDTATTNPIVIDGTPATPPIPPDITADDILLALVDVSANASVIYSADIIDKIIYVPEFEHILIPTDELLKSDDSIESSNSTSYVKIKDFTGLVGNLIGSLSELRIKFDLRNDFANSGAVGRIYKNGVAHGTEQTSSLVAYATKSEDISGWSDGDTIELWIKNDDGPTETTYVRNLRVYGRFEVLKKVDW